MAHDALAWAFPNIRAGAEVFEIELQTMDDALHIASHPIERIAEAFEAQALDSSSAATETPQAHKLTFVYEGINTSFLQTQILAALLHNFFFEPW
jgi:hypothetical protein